MKIILISLITFYQKIISSLLKQALGITSSCRYSPTCSEYTKKAIQQYGILQGLKKGIVRLLHCQPFSNAYGNI